MDGPDDVAQIVVENHVQPAPALEHILERAAIDVIDRYREAFCVLNQEVRYLARRPILLLLAESMVAE